MKQHFCPAEQSMIAFEKECNWCGELESQERTWVGLTVEEIADCCRESTATQLSFYRAIEAKLKEKNGYAEVNNK
jgi:hypothetical protein